MPEFPPCPKCNSEYVYPNDELLICPECFYEWNPNDMDEQTENTKVLDANGNELKNGDSVIIIKDLPVKGSPKPVKMGTKVKNIPLPMVTTILTAK